MEILIRRACPEDNEHIVAHIILAMEDIIFRFIGEESSEKAFAFLSSLVKERGNLYSYENCWVAEHGSEVVATAVVYDGADYSRLKIPVANRVKAMFGRSFEFENETGPGENYVDSVGVSREHQGKGIGSRLFRFLIEEYVSKKRTALGLLVDKENPTAKKLYLKLGFEKVGDLVLAGKSMEHLQVKHKNIY